MLAGVLVDTMTFSYLLGLGFFNVVDCLGRKTGKLFVSAAVRVQLHRSGIGTQVDGMIAQKVLLLESPAHGDPVSRAVKTTLDGKDAALVRRNRTDVELVELAREKEFALVTRETGIDALASRRRVMTADIAELLAWAVRAACAREQDVEKRIAEKWKTKSAAGTGAPSDFTASDTLASLLKRRHGHDDLARALDALVAPASPPKPATE